MQSLTPTHPVEFDVEYPDRPLDRLSTLFRLIFALPILVAARRTGRPGVRRRRRRLAVLHRPCRAAWS